MVSKKDRFEVFKRDKFQCQYCGRCPPQVVLELEHINPKCKGGKDVIENYLTACFDCNRGKGKNLLTTLPKSVEVNLNELKEKRLQLHEYNLFLQQEEQTENEAINYLTSIFEEHFKGYTFSDTFKTGLKRFTRRLPLNKVQEALELAINHFPQDRERCIRYFCGICWHWIKLPESKDW